MKICWFVALVACGPQVRDAGPLPITEHERARSFAPVTHTYYIAAEPLDWSYAPLGHDPRTQQAIPAPWGERLVYPKLRYVQYSDASFATRVVQPVWEGILGPTLRASVGDTLRIEFWNRTERTVSMHPHGVKYAPTSEGASHGTHDPATRGVAAPGARVTYTWIADDEAGPAPHEPSSKVWLYHSHVTAVDFYAGLVGTIVITDPARARKDRRPADVDREFTALFLVWNENTPEIPEPDREGNLKHAINGLVFGNLEGFDMKVGERVRWYLVALGNEVDLHTAHWHGETVATETGSHTDVIELLPASMRTVDMRADNPGDWMFHCHVADHMAAGMYTMYRIRPR